MPGSTQSVRYNVPGPGQAFCPRPPPPPIPPHIPPLLAPFCDRVTVRATSRLGNFLHGQTDICRFVCCGWSIACYRCDGAQELNRRNSGEYVESANTSMQWLFGVILKVAPLEIKPLLGIAERKSYMPKHSVDLEIRLVFGFSRTIPLTWTYLELPLRRCNSLEIVSVEVLIFYNLSDV